MIVKDKTVYVVRGSEDGVLGVYTTIKRAYRVASKYAENNTPSYQAACKALRQHRWIEIVEPNSRGGVYDVSAQIRPYKLNRE